ncbi:MAG: permease, partial [Gorillibacterium sp.]|nr:permease [Gorillibacterium sp.]
MQPKTSQVGINLIINLDLLQSFKTMFISIVLEAFPFMLLGVVVSSLIQVFISEQTIQRWIPKNPILGLVFGCLLGIIFPLCECGVIPIIRRLLSKGMPLYMGVVFILVGPIVNPIVFFATYTAFRSTPEIIAGRMVLSIVVGFSIGLTIYTFFKNNQLRNSRDTLYGQITIENSKDQKSGESKLVSILEHAGSEFFEMGKYLLFGCVVAAAVQTIIPRAELIGVGQAPLGSHFFMMAFAFLLSICST